MKLSSTPLPPPPSPPPHHSLRFGLGEGLEYIRKITHDQVKTVHVVLSDTHKSMKHTDKEQLDEQYSKSIQ